MTSKALYQYYNSDDCRRTNYESYKNYDFSYHKVPQYDRTNARRQQEDMKNLTLDSQFESLQRYIKNDQDRLLHLDQNTLRNFHKMRHSNYVTGSMVSRLDSPQLYYEYDNTFRTTRQKEFDDAKFWEDQKKKKTYDEKTDFVHLWKKELEFVDPSEKKPGVKNPLEFDDEEEDRYFLHLKDKRGWGVINDYMNHGKVNNKKNDQQEQNYDDEDQDHQQTKKRYQKMVIQEDQQEDLVEDEISEKGQRKRENIDENESLENSSVQKVRVNKLTNSSMMSHEDLSRSQLSRQNNHQQQPQQQIQSKHHYTSNSPVRTEQTLRNHSQDSIKVLQQYSNDTSQVMQNNSYYQQQQQQQRYTQQQQQYPQRPQYNHQSFGQQQQTQQQQQSFQFNLSTDYSQISQNQQISYPRNDSYLTNDENENRPRRFSKVETMNEIEADVRQRIRMKKQENQYSGKKYSQSPRKKRDDIVELSKQIDRQSSKNTYIRKSNERDIQQRALSIHKANALKVLEECDNILEMGGGTVRSTHVQQKPQSFMEVVKSNIPQNY